MSCQVVLYSRWLIFGFFFCYFCCCRCCHSLAIFMNWGVIIIAKDTVWKHVHSFFNFYILRTRIQCSKPSNRCQLDVLFMMCIQRKIQKHKIKSNKARYNLHIKSYEIIFLGNNITRCTLYIYTCIMFIVVLSHLLYVHMGGNGCSYTHTLSLVLASAAMQIG